MGETKKYRLIVDSNYLAYLNYFALPHGLSFNGVSTEIIYGFLRDIIVLAHRFETNDIVFCWDTKSNLRKEIYPMYKSKRKREQSDREKDSDAHMFRQFELLRDKVLHDLGFMNSFYQDGYEGDDVIAQIVKTDNTKKQLIVVSSDHDLYQLLDRCSLYNYKKREILNRELFVRLYGIEPAQWVDVMELSGCVTDDVPGIEGVGTTKALSYVKGEMTKGKVFDRIRTCDRDYIELTRSLVLLPYPGTQTPLIRKNTFTFEKYEKVCQQYGFKSLLSEKYKNDWKKIITF